MFIQRELSHELKKAFAIYPVVTIIGPRKSGKSTLAKEIFPELPYINLESPEELDIIKKTLRHF